MPTGRGAQIMVVEDDPFIGLDLADRLEGAGYRVVGPIVNATRALAEIAACAPTVVILDVNLGDHTSEAVAQALNDAAIPFITLSGYSADQLPAAFADHPVLSKPVQLPALLDELAELLPA